MTQASTAVDLAADRELRRSLRLLDKLKTEVVWRLTEELAGGREYFRRGVVIEEGSGWTSGTSATAEQEAAVRTSRLGLLAQRVVEQAFLQKGAAVAQSVVDLAVAYFAASGMLYRLRCADLARRAGEATAGAVDLAHVPAFFPSSLDLWKRPVIAEGEPNEGFHSMETADRAQLLDVATRFFHTGVRYAPFEKVLLETLLHLDYYNATKALRSKGTGLTTRVERGLLMAWAYRRTLGADPAYLLHVGLGGAGLFVTKVALLLGAAWWAFSHYDATGSRPALLALALVGVLVARWIGRSLVRMVVGWAAPPDRLAARFVYGTPVHESLQGLHDLVQLVSASGVAPTQLREALARSDAHVSIPPIVAAYLDRAIAEKEFLWPPPEKP